MFAKCLLVGAAACSLLLAQPQTADAGVKVSVDVTATTHAHESSYQPVQYQPYHYDYDDDEDDEDDEDRITCWEGRRVVRRAGYRQVRTVSCYGDIYRYRAIKRGFLWRISVDSDTGDIIRARKIRSVQHTYY